MSAGIMPQGVTDIQGARAGARRCPIVQISRHDPVRMQCERMTEGHNRGFLHPVWDACHNRQSAAILAWRQKFLKNILMYYK